MLVRDRGKTGDRAARRVHEVMHRTGVEKYSFDDRCAETGILAINSRLDSVEPAFAAVPFFFGCKRRPVVEPIKAGDANQD